MRRRLFLMLHLLDIPERRNRAGAAIRNQWSVGLLLPAFLESNRWNKTVTAQKVGHFFPSIALPVEKARHG